MPGSNSCRSLHPASWNTARTSPRLPKASAPRQAHSCKARPGLLPTAHTAAECGRVKLALDLAGAPIPENDLWIAAAVPEHGLPLATRDAHFNRVPGLTVHEWH